MNTGESTKKSTLSSSGIRQVQVLVHVAFAFNLYFRGTDFGLLKLHVA